MIGHLGDRVSALLDGQMTPAEEERAWAHVHACHQCRDLVEREGWVKTRLAGLSFDTACAPSSSRARCSPRCSAGLPPGDLYLASEPPTPDRVGSRSSPSAAAPPGRP